MLSRGQLQRPLRKRPLKADRSSVGRFYQLSWLLRMSHRGDARIMAIKVSQTELNSPDFVIAISLRRRSVCSGISESADVSRKARRSMRGVRHGRAPGASSRKRCRPWRGQCKLLGAAATLNTGFTYLGESPKRGGICCVSGKWSRGAPAFHQPGRRPASISCSKTCRIVPVNSTRQRHTSRLLLDPLHG
jgi:hypothetical protein